MQRSNNILITDDEIKPLIKALQAFDFSNLNQDTITETCKQLGWVDESDFHLIGIYRINDELRLFAPYEDDSQLRYEPRIPLLFWEGWDLELADEDDDDDFDPDEAPYRSEDDYLETRRVALDVPFDFYLSKTSEVIGAPVVTGAAPDKIDEFYETGWRIPGYRYAVWHFRKGLLILQQTVIYPPDGEEVSLWLCPWKEGDPLPELPFYYG